jgi:hypothetical protein
METVKRNLNQKLLEFQTSIETIKKDGKNNFFKKPDGSVSSYATLPNILSEVKPILNALKLVLTQPVVKGEVKTVITDTESGEVIESSICLDSSLNAQQTGSAITYYRRYTLSSLLALEIDEDDDGNAASATKAPEADTRDWLNRYTDKSKQIETENWNKVTEALKSGKYSIGDVEKKYKLSKELKAELIQIQNNGQ